MLTVFAFRATTGNAAAMRQRCSLSNACNAAGANDGANGAVDMSQPEWPIVAPSESSSAIILQSCRNMLEGSTGAAAWPAGLWLAQFALNNPQLFRGHRCLELGCGVGMLGVCLARCGASEVRSAAMSNSKVT